MRLAELLDSNGPHEAGRAFLDGFLATVLPEVARSAGPAGRSEHWVVEANKKLPNQIHPKSKKEVDILLLCPAAGVAVVIENKIEAVEGAAQLDNYWAWLDTQRVRFPVAFVYFLTPEGRPATSDSSGRSIPISYRALLTWLDATLPGLAQSKAKTLVEQYRASVTDIL